MTNETEFPAPEEPNENAPEDPAKKERDEQDSVFLSKLKRMSDEAEANNADGKQRNFDFSEEESEDEPFKPEFAGDQQNPKESYDLYYAIRRLLMQGLPGGKLNKKLRQTVYDEKNLYLRQGIGRPLDNSTIGADSRMSFLQFLREAYSTTQNWANRGGSPYDIFIEYYNLNKQMRYR